MKTKKIELDVDFIGEQVSLKAEEEKALSEFFRQRQLTSRKLLGTSNPKNEANKIN
jgi:hypothetical protein